MEGFPYEITDDHWKSLLSVFQVIAERGRKVRLAQEAATADNAPLAGDMSTAADQPSAQKADSE